jgi:hypothetical protein
MRLDAIPVTHRLPEVLRKGSTLHAAPVISAALAVAERERANLARVGFSDDMASLFRGWLPSDLPPA